MPRTRSAVQFNSVRRPYNVALFSAFVLLLVITGYILPGAHAQRVDLSPRPSKAQRPRHKDLLDSLHQEDDKYTIALKLISRADANKDVSLREVLRESAVDNAQEEEKSSRGTAGKRRETGAETTDGGVSTTATNTERIQMRRQTRNSQPRNHDSQQYEPEIQHLDGWEASDSTRFESEEAKVQANALEEPVILRTWSEVFAWAINSTVHHTETLGYANASRLVFAPRKSVHSDGSSMQTFQDVVEYPTEEKASSLTLRADRHVQAALPASMSENPQSAYTGRNSLPMPLHVTWASETESDVMFEALSRLQSNDASAQSRVDALLILEELCHSIDNGVDLHAAGGLQFVVESMSADEAHVRASAAWALGTCAQNNPTVQNASVGLGAVPVLVIMAADDKDLDVCARALLALNALLELSPARDLFEEMALGIQALRRPLVERKDSRATRRALNLAELLVRANLDSWKTQFEAWDLGPIVESLMRDHDDVDVRESAARLISALEGRSTQ